MTDRDRHLVQQGRMEERIRLTLAHLTDEELAALANRSAKERDDAHSRFVLATLMQVFRREDERR